MRKLFTILCVALIMPLFYACGSDDPMDDPNDPDNPSVIVPTDESIVGTWHFKRGNSDYYYDFHSDGNHYLHITQNGKQKFWTKFKFEQDPQQNIITLKDETPRQNREVISYKITKDGLYLNYGSFEIEGKKVKRPDFIGYVGEPDNMSIILDSEKHKIEKFEFFRYGSLDAKKTTLTLNIENSEPFHIVFENFVTNIAFQQMWEKNKSENLLTSQYLKIKNLKIGSKHIYANQNSRIVVVYADASTVVLDVYIEAASPSVIFKSFNGTIIGEYN